jgi:hypothetical protein
MVFHIGGETPEMNSLIDLNSFGLPEIGKHRGAELRALTSAEFRTELKRLGIVPITYGEAIRKAGLQNMKAPSGSGY